MSIQSNDFLEPLVQLLRRHPKRVVFPEAEDPRVLRVAEELARRECVSPILLGERRKIEAIAAAEGVDMEFIGVVNPTDSSDFEAYCERYRRSARLRNQIIRQPHETISKPQYFAAMMALYGAADAVVGGNLLVPAAFFRAMFHILPRLGHLECSTSCMVARLETRRDIGVNGVIFLTDCAVISNPTVRELAEMAVETAKVAANLLGELPRVAMLSFSTRGSARNLSTERMRAATAMAAKLAREQNVSMEVDGELQLGVALNPAAAARKTSQSSVAGRANVLVFPDLNSSHISFNLLEHLAGAECYGQMVLGLSRPCTQVSRVVTEQALFGAAICAAYRAVQYRELVLSETWDA